MMFLSKNWYFSVQKALIYYTVNKSYHNSFILLVFSHVVNFRYVANFKFLTLCSMFQNALYSNLTSGDLVTIDLYGTDQVTDLFFKVVLDFNLKFPSLTKLNLSGKFS